MYPILRLSKEMIRASRMPKLPPGGVHETHHLCWPIDLDFQMEMNNGRVLTSFDLGRIPLAVRVNLFQATRKMKWGFAMAGASVRYRRRIVAFDRLRMTSRALARDERFFYMEQTLWRRDEAVASILCRAATTSRAGIVPTDEVADVMGYTDWRPEAPDWVTAWIAADVQRPWPPQS